MISFFHYMGLEAPVTDRYHDAVRQILASQEFHDSPAQQKLLAYLAKKSLDGTAGELKEYTIGVDLFGKPENYSPQSDPSVRVQAGRLRRKLEEYYRAEGSSASEIVQFPKGSFSLVFSGRQGTSPPIAPVRPAHELMAQIPSTRRVARSSIAGAIVGAIVILLVGVCVWQFFSLRRIRTELAQKSPSPAVAELWAPVFNSPRPLLLVLGVPLFLRVPGGTYRNAEVNSPEDAATAPAVQDLLRRMNVTQLRFFHSYTGVGEAEAIFLLGRLFQSAGKPVTTSRSNELGWDEAATHDLILVGSSKSQPHLREVGLLVNYRLVPGGIQVLNPAPGETSFYQPTQVAHQTPTEDYALIARLPGLNGTGYVLVIGADSTSGTWAGTEFASDPRYAQAFIARLRDSRGRLPEYFELIVKAKFKGDRPVSIEYVQHRSLPNNR